MLAAVTLAAALFSAAAVQAGTGKPPSGGQPPCPSCPDRTPPAGGAPPSSSGGSGPSAVPAQPLFSLRTLSAGNGQATVTGAVNVSLGSGGSGSTSANLQLSVNGKQVAISAAGNFSATTNTSANGGVTVQANDASAGVSYSITVPGSAIPSSGIAAGALAQLNADKVTLMMPVDGFVSIDGNGLDATVRVGGTTGIAQLDLNGASLLAKLQAGSSGSSSTSGSTKPGSVKPGGGSAPAPHSASAPVSGSAKKVKLSVTATNGSNQTTTVRIQRIRSVIRIGRFLSVSAFGARGIRISKIVFNRSALRTTGRLGVAVTVQDHRHYLVRDAVVMLQPYAHHTTIHSSWARMSNTLGRATFSVPVTSGSIGHRLYLRVVAQTPRSQTRLTASTLLMACGC